MEETQSIRAHMVAKIEYHHDIEVEVPLTVSPDEVMTALRERGEVAFAEVCQTSREIEPELTLTLTEDENSPQQRSPQLAYAYMVSLTTHQLLHQDVIVESNKPLSKKAIVEAAIELAWKGAWEEDEIDPSLDIDEIQTLRNGTKLGQKPECQQ